MSFNLFILKCRLLEISSPLSYDIIALGHSWCGRTSWGRDMLFGSLSGSVGYCKKHTALTDERHTRQRDGPHLGLLSRSQTHEHMKDRWLCLGSSETQGMLPLLSLLPQMRLENKTHFVLGVWCVQATVHHRMVILAMKRETSGINRWLPLVFHVALLYTWPSILLAKNNTFLSPQRTCMFSQESVRRVVRAALKKICCGFQERQRYFLLDGRKVY